MLKYLLFDLDNTLYSCHYGLEKNVSRRIWEFAAALLGKTPEEVRRQRMEAKKQYGTCLEWLMTEEGFTDVEAYFAAVHPPGEADSLTPDPVLRTFLENISIPKAVLTNAPREHADVILDKLGVSDLFTHVFDVRQCNFLGKPRREFFDHALRTLGVSIEEVLFVDDHPFYVEGFVAMGGKGILLDEDDFHSDYTQPKIRALNEITRYIS
ncbi:MAG: HAD-IA family hydrolase [Treponema sp.]|jgi:putative hydrolase of the HAD superfamily|nr:HAD-IA family hydrolase [Treponema sp.]